MTTISLALLSLSSMVSSVPQAQIDVYVNGQPVAFADARPRMMGQRVMVPLRGVFEEMGAGVSWNEARQEVTATTEEKTIILRVGSFSALVNNQEYMMDVAPAKWSNRVYVPLRFLSETMGAEVRWDPQLQAVYITSDSNGTPINNNNNQNNQNVEMVMVPVDTVIAVSLDKPLNSASAKKGDKFTATLDTKGMDNYADLPKGTKVEGIVALASPKKKDSPGVLDLSFTSVVLPNGKKFPMEARLFNLDEKNITTENGVMTAKPQAKKDDLKYVGYGAGAGVLLALVTKGNVLTSGLIGGALGYLFGLTQNDAKSFKDVELKEGTTVGLVLTENLRISDSK
jgi:hypothetical protein